MNAAWQQRTRLTCCNAHSSHTPARPSRVQRYSSSMHRAMEEDSLMIRHDDDDCFTTYSGLEHSFTCPGYYNIYNDIRLQAL